jgi:putative peptidoglycan lipid II flippase
MNSPVSLPPKQRNTRIPIASIATLLVSTALIGQVLGFLRTKLVNSNFPAVGPNSTDAYFAAFNIPDFFFFTIAAGALGVAFMPILSDHIHRGDRKGAHELTSSLLNLMAIVMLFVGIIIFVFAEPLIKHVVAPSMEGATLHNTVTIMRLLAFNPFLFTISGILSSYQQTIGRFFFYALGPLFYNTSIISSILVFSMAPGHDGGPGHLGLIGLGIGALVGAIAQLLIIAVGLTNLRFRWHPKIIWRSADFRLILKQLPPRSLDQGIDQLNSIVETRFARRLGEGYISYYNNAYVLSTAPTLLIGTAISTAAFPRLNQRLSQGRPDLFRRDFLKILRAMIWISAPIALVAFFARGYLARLIFSQNAPEIALILQFLVGAIFFRTLYTLISRWFYAQKDTKTPLLISLFTISFNIVLAYFLSKPTSYGVSGLALAQSIVAMVEVIILMTVMLIRDHQLLDKTFWSGCVRIISVTGFSALAGYIAANFFPLGELDRGFITLGAKLGIITLAIFVTHVAMSALFGLEEVRPLFYRLRKFVLKPIRVE